MNAAQFIDALGEVQRHAMAHKLRPGRIVRGDAGVFQHGAVERKPAHPHPAPNTGLIVAHAKPRASGQTVLGASYDHRLLSGFDAAQVLQALAQPPA